MLDFLRISTVRKQSGVEIKPIFVIKKTNDLMIRGRDFYAIWDKETNLWSRDEDDAIRMIDKELEKEANEYFEKYRVHPTVKYMWDSSSGAIDDWHKYCQKQMRDSYKNLDDKLIFSNQEITKKDYASKKLCYPLEKGSIEAYDKLISTLYSDEERHKIEWAIGSIVAGDSVNIQKFLVFYGSAGTGKSTILNIIQKLFDGYCSVFDAKALGSSTAVFALETFKSNPLVAIQHDGDLSRIEDNTRLNSLVSHELMTVNEKYKATYENRFNAFLFMGTNKPVKITDAKSGLIRRLIDVSPTGNKLPAKEYKQLIKQIDFELGHIAWHCKEVYLSNPDYYDNYIPTSMIGATNDFFNFVEDSYFIFKKENSTTLKSSWEMYKNYCDDARVQYPLTQRAFKEELKNYFENFYDRYTLNDGTRVRNYYSGFQFEKFENLNEDKANDIKNYEDIEDSWLNFKEQHSLLDDMLADCKAQYANKSGTPNKKWEDVNTTLKSINTSKLHFVQVPFYHIVIDFDLTDESGSKSFSLNFKEASKWPKTYAELSKSGSGIHLHYIFTGDVSKLSRIYSDKIEIKVFNGNASLRRMLTKCNDIPVASISSGLPLKGGKNVINREAIKDAEHLRALVIKNLKKEIHPGTKPSIDFIYKLLEDAYNNGVKYDLTTLRTAVLQFAANSTHQSKYCMDLVNKMKFKSEDDPEPVVKNDAPIVFFDCEVFPNLFVLNWKFRGKDKKVNRMINPSPAEVERLFNYNLIGFNCRKYDNHIVYARHMGYTEEQLFKLSCKIINKSANCFFGEAYNLSYTDIYDYAAKKQSLKKWEIELGIHHMELGLAWDKPVPKELWNKVAEYCDNDVLATEAVFEATQADFMARIILADLANGTVNDTTNTLTTKIIFGNDKHPQSKFNYRNMGKMPEEVNLLKGYPGIHDYKSSDPIFDEYTVFDKENRPIFPGYKYEFGKSTYRGEEVGEGGYVYAEPGIYWWLALLDVASMHPHSILAECLFGVYTKRFDDIVQARIDIKHEDWEKLKHLLDGKLMKYAQKVIDGEMTSKDLAYALKIAINSVYGLTAAKFEHPFHDPRNVDNIVAKRGALFMINLKHEVQKRGFTVAHIKTDSIKIVNATKEIIDFVSDYGKMYGYSFEHEATYERMCLVNDAVYIARYASAEDCKRLYGYVPGDNKKHPGEWTATGTQFQVPYVFKKLFSKEPITFEDMCETKSVSKGEIYIDMNEGLKDISLEEKELEKYSKLLSKQDFKKYSKEDLEKSIKTLSDIISENHNYIFVGRVGQFCPILPEYGGGVLYRKQDDKYYALAGTKGYRWLESEIVKNLNKQDFIDISYYNGLVDDAVATISQYGDFEAFASTDFKLNSIDIPEDPLPIVVSDPLPEEFERITA